MMDKNAFLEYLKSGDTHTQESSDGGFLVPEVIDIYYTGITRTIREMLGKSTIKYRYRVADALVFAARKGKRLTEEERAMFRVDAQ